MWLTLSILQAVEMEFKISAVENNRTYAQLKPEEPDDDATLRFISGWPGAGKIEFKNYSAKYREELDWVLKDVNLVIPPGVKVGVIGRTGSGKSSFVLSLFRLFDVTSGIVEVDGVDIKNICLVQLRSRIQLILDQPVLFTGTLRENLDPFNIHTDENIWRVLEITKLKEWVLGISEERMRRAKLMKTSQKGESYEDLYQDGLALKISKKGANISINHRLSICLARTILHKSSILIIDETTTALDPQFEQLFNDIIKSEFSDCTVIKIAHRVKTILSCDKIIVIDQGNVVEYGDKNTLIANPESALNSLIRLRKFEIF